MSVYLGLAEMPREVRKNAWLLMLGIDVEGEEYAAHAELYQAIIFNKDLSKSSIRHSSIAIENQIIKDVYRTFSSLGKFNQDPATGKNKLFNVLKAYSFINDRVKYT